MIQATTKTAVRFSWCNNRPTYGATLVLALCLGCGEETASDRARQSAPVIRGTPTTSPVVFSFGCTGTFIGKRVAITARHCVAGWESRLPHILRLTFYKDKPTPPRYSNDLPTHVIEHIYYPELPSTSNPQKTTKPDIALVVFRDEIVRSPIGYCLNPIPKWGQASLWGAGCNVSPDHTGLDQSYYEFDGVLRRISQYRRDDSVRPDPTSVYFLPGSPGCPGDSGGPYRPRSGHVAAIHSGGFRGRAGMGDFASQTAPLHEWIQAKVGHLGTRAYDCAYDVGRLPAPGTDCHQGWPNGHYNYCSSSCKCGEGEGHCNGLSSCQDGLVCRSWMGEKYGLDPELSVCVPPDGPSTGCRILQKHCAKHPEYTGSFYSTWDGADKDQDRCMRRAEEIPTFCGNPPGEETRAEFIHRNFVVKRTKYLASGCLLTLSACSAHPEKEVGELPEKADNRNQCYQRARDYVAWCGPGSGRVEARWYSEGRSRGYISLGTGSTRPLTY